jgi:hypothetical protein
MIKMQYDVYNDRVIDRETDIEYNFKDISIEQLDKIINDIEIDIYLFKKDLSRLKKQRFKKNWLNLFGGKYDNK